MEIAVCPPRVVVATTLGVIGRLERGSGMMKSASSCVFVTESLEMSIARHHLAAKKRFAGCWTASTAAILIHVLAALLRATPTTCLLIGPSLTSRAHAAMC